MRRITVLCIWFAILGVNVGALVSGAIAQEETSMMFVEVGHTLTVYAHVDNTYIAVYDSSNNLIWEGVLNAGQFERIATEPGTYRCVGNSSYPGFGVVPSERKPSEELLRPAGALRADTVSVSASEVAEAGPLQVICVPWQGDPNLSHVAYKGKEVTLQGTVKGLKEGVYYEYEWDFDDGTSTGPVPLANPYIIEAKHTYTSSPEFPGGFPIGTLLEPTLTVYGNDYSEASDEFPIIIQDETLDAKVNIAISEGLWYMHKRMVRWSADYEPPKIVGSWLWVTCPTSPECGGQAVEVGTDWMSVASGGAVTEAAIAATGSTAGDPVGDKVWTWGSISPTGGDNINDLVNAIGLGEGDVDSTVAYGVIELTAASVQNNVMMYVGSDDGIRVWLNGTVVWENPVDRGANDYQEQFPVTLNAGSNILMVAVYECGGAWSGFFGINANFTAGGINYVYSDGGSVDYGAYPDWWGDDPPPEGDYWWLAYHSQAMEAFQNQGHLVTGDLNEDPYVEDVQRGLNWILRNITSYDVTSLDQKQYACWHDWLFNVEDTDGYDMEQLLLDLNDSCSSGTPLSGLPSAWQTVFADNGYTLSASATVYNCNPDDRWWSIWDEELENDWQINTDIWWEDGEMHQRFGANLWGCWGHTATAEGYAEDYDSNGILDDGGNGIGLSASGDYMYTYGIALLALASSRAPGRLAAPVGIPSVDGRPYADIVQDMVDFGVWSQNEGSAEYPADPGRRGGWRYNSNYLNSDNSVTQWPVLGIFAAESEPFNAKVPQWAKDELEDYWIPYSQGYPSGGFGYSIAGDWENIAKTGPGLIQFAWVDTSIIDPRGVNARGFIADDWDHTMDPAVNPGDSNANKGNYYAMYGVMKGARLTSTDPTTSSGQIEKFGDVDWYEDYANYLVAEQRSDGSWPEEGVPHTGTDMNTAWAVLILTPTVFANPPTAVLKVQPNPADVDIDITFDGSDSYVAPSAPVGTVITTYEFDFGDGATYTETADSAPDGMFDGMTTHSYDNFSYEVGYPDGYPATLKVIDSQDPPQESAPAGVPVKIVPPDHPPTAVIKVDPPAWESERVGIDFEAIADPSVELTFDGSGSYDTDEWIGDEIASWDWDLDGDGEYDDASGTLVTQLYTLPGGSLGEVFKVSLRVQDTGNEYWNPTGPLDGYAFMKLLIRPPNSPPVADAGKDRTEEQTSLAGAKVWLDGSGSYDPDKDPLTYEWTWLGGSASGVYPQIGLPLGSIEITLVVNDGLVDSETDYVTITVVDTKPPNISITGVAGSQDGLGPSEYWNDSPIVVSFEAEDTCDADLDIVSNIGDLDKDAGTVTIDPDPLVGSVTVTITATDDTGNSSSASTSFTVVLRVPDGDLIIKPEVLKVNPGILTAFVVFPDPYSALTITDAECDGAPLNQLNLDEKEDKAILKFRRQEMTEDPLDTYFVVRGTFIWNGVPVPFQGSDSIMEVLPDKVPE